MSGAIAAPGWWRRNAVGLIASAVGLVLVAVVLVAWPLSGVARRDVVQTVPIGGTYTWQGREFRVRAAGISGRSGSTIDTPPGSGLVAVLITVHATAAAKARESGSCGVQLVVPGGAGRDDRIWDPEITPREFGYAANPDWTDNCLLTEPEDLTLEEVFLTPKGTYPKAAVDVSIGNGLNAKIVRFELPASPKRF
jgi:hypothetical protein